MDESATTPERWERIQQLFHEALAADDRAAFLAEACGSDRDLRSRVESLVAAAADDDRFMEESHGAVLVDAFGEEGDASPAAGRRIGGFRIVREIGSGGMGSVYEAVQEHPHRTVALKLMRGGVPSRAALRRFTYESEILGRLRHPAVAHVYESGTHDDGSGAVPWFAMEFVPDARSIVQYATDEELDVRARLGLVADVCDAVQHGHQMGVIHRDLKPANILVDGEGRPKVIDFGVARVLDANAPVTTLQTGVGQLIGTLQYMSPEQCSGDPAAVDARCDVYALGVILYELLAGEPPYELDSRSLPESIRTIGEVEPRRLSSINRVFRGDLDTIVSKAIDKDPPRRYQSASELAADIRRTLRDEPIVARPASALYQLGKFARRNKALVGGAAGIFVVSLAGFVVSTGLFVRADSARRAEAIQKRIAGEKAAEAERARDDAELGAYVANIAAASSALRAHDVADARRRLDQAPAHLRNWEWRHLDRRLDRSLVTIDGDTPVVKCVAFSPDGALLAHGTTDGRVLLRDGVDGRLLATLNGHRDVVDAIAFSPDGERLASGAVAIKVWHVESFAPAGPDLAGHTQVHGLAFSPDGTRLVSGGMDGAVRLWDVASGLRIAEFAGYEDRVSETVFSPDGRTVAASSWDGTVRFFNGETLRPTVAITAHTRSASDVTFDGAGRLIASAGGNGVIRLIDAGSMEVTAALRGHTSRVLSVAFSPDGARLASASVDKTVRVWDVAEQRQVAVLTGHSETVHQVAWNHDGTLIASGASDGTVRLWSPATEDVRTLRGHGGWVYDVAVSADGGLVVSSGSVADSSVRLWDRATGAQTNVLAGHTRSAWSVALSADGRRLVSGGGDGIVRVWSIGLADPPLELSGHASGVFAVDFNPDGRRVVSGSRDGTVRQWTLDAAASEVVMAGHADWVWCVAFDPDGTLVASGSRDGTVRLWKAADGTPLGVLTEAGSAVRDLAFSRDGERLAAGTRGGDLVVWRTSTWEHVVTRSAQADPVYAVAFSPDGSRLATGSADYTIKLWDAGTWREMATLHGHTWHVWSLEFTSDGADLISASADGTVKVWDGGARPKLKADN